MLRVKRGRLTQEGSGAFTRTFKLTSTTGGLRQIQGRASSLQLEPSRVFRKGICPSRQILNENIVRNDDIPTYEDKKEE